MNYSLYMILNINKILTDLPWDPMSHFDSLPESLHSSFPCFFVLYLVRNGKCSIMMMDFLDHQVFKVSTLLGGVLMMKGG